MATGTDFLLAASPSPAHAFERDLLPVLADGCHRLHKAWHELRHITLEVTRRCNLRCAHCYAGAGPEEGEGELDFRELAALGYQIRRDFGTRVPLSITGGEPLCRTDLLPLLGFYRVLGLRVSLSTNGTLHTAKKLSRLAECISGLAISLDGLRRGHERLRGAGSFAPALRGIVMAARDPGLRVVVKTTVHRQNLAELEGLHRILRGLDIAEWHLFPVEAEGRAEGNASVLLTPREYRLLCAFFDRVKADPGLHICFGEQNSFLRRRPAGSTGHLKRCNAGVSSLAVLADGSVTGCVQGMRSPEEAQGNVRSARLIDIWQRGFTTCRAASWRHCGRHRHAENELSSKA